MENPHFSIGKPSISMGHLYHGKLLVITRGYMEYMGSIHFGLKICRVNMGSEGMSFIRLPRSEWTTRMDCGDALFTATSTEKHRKYQETRLMIKTNPKLATQTSCWQWADHNRQWYRSGKLNWGRSAGRTWLAAHQPDIPRVVHGILARISQGFGNLMNNTFVQLVNGVHDSPKIWNKLE